MYVDIVISKVFNLNKKKILFFFLESQENGLFIKYFFENKTRTFFIEIYSNEVHSVSNLYCFKG